MQVSSHNDHGDHHAHPRVPLEELRRKALVPYADAAYPPLYIAVIAGLLWLRVSGVHARISTSDSLATKDELRQEPLMYMP